MLGSNALNYSNLRSSSYLIRTSKHKNYILSKSVGIKDHPTKSKSQFTTPSNIKILNRHRESGKETSNGRQSAKSSLLQRLTQIESINNFRKNKPMIKKNVSKLIKKYAKNSWDSFFISGNVSNSTYDVVNQSIKKRTLHLDSSIFLNSAIVPSPEQTKDEIELLSKQAPGQLLNFVNGFPDYCRKDQIESLNKETNLWILKEKINHSEGLNKLYQALLEDKYYRQLRQESLSNNFISAVHALQFITKNGSIDDKSKQILQLSFCTL